LNVTLAASSRRRGADVGTDLRSNVTFGARIPTPGIGPERSQARTEARCRVASLYVDVNVTLGGRNVLFERR
jgi:hypothetical protein